MSIPDERIEEKDVVDMIAADPDGQAVRCSNALFERIIETPRVVEPAAYDKRGRGARLCIDDGRLTLRFDLTNYDKPISRATADISQIRSLIRNHHGTTRSDKQRIHPFRPFVDARSGRPPTDHPTSHPRKESPTPTGSRPPPERAGVVWIVNPGDKTVTMTNQLRTIDFMLGMSFDRGTYTNGGRCIVRDFTRGERFRTYAPGRTRPIQIGLFPKTLGGIPVDELELRINPIMDAFKFYYRHGWPSNPDGERVADEIFRIGGHLFKLVAAAHSLDDWFPMTNETAYRFHYHRNPDERKNDKDKRRRNPYFYFLLARSITVHRPRKKYVIPLIDSKPGLTEDEPWSMRRPRAMASFQSRPTGAIHRLPRRSDDVSPLIYSVSEAMLQSGGGAIDGKGIPVLIDSPDGTGWIDPLVLWSLCGRPEPVDHDGRQDVRRYIVNKIKRIMDDAMKPDALEETIRFELHPGSRSGSRPAQIKIVASDFFRDAHRDERRMQSVPAPAALSPVDNSKACG